MYEETPTPPLRMPRTTGQIVHSRPSKGGSGGVKPHLPPTPMTPFTPSAFLCSQGAQRPSAAVGPRRLVAPPVAARPLPLSLPLRRRPPRPLKSRLPPTPRPHRALHPKVCPGFVPRP